MRTWRALVASLAVIGCTPSKPVELVALSGKLGPAGGSLTAPETDGLAGARLEVPAGALDTEVEFSFVPGDDETPLPGDGFRVGPLFAIEPVTTKLKAPVRITYPFDPAARAAFPNTDAECRVWQRSADGWSGVAQTASTESSVTIETSSLALGAAGVQRAIIVNVCGTSAMPCALPGPCTSPMGLCMTRLGDPIPKPFTPFSVGVARAKVVYASRPAGEPIRGVVYSYPSAQTTVSPPLTNPSMGASIGRPDMAPNEDVWVVLPGVSTTKFPRVAPPERFDTESARLSRGVAVSSTGTVSRFVRDTVDTSTVYRLVKDQQQFTITSDFRGVVNFVPRRALNTFIAWDRSRGLVFFDGTSDVTAQHLVSPPSGFFVADVATSYKSAAFAVLFVNAEGTQRKLSMFATAPTSLSDQPTRRDFDGVIDTQIEYGSDDRVYAFTSVRAQIDVFDATTGGVSNIPLTNAPVTSSDYRELLPLALRNVHPTGELLLVTTGTTASPFFLAIKRAGNP